MFPNNEDKSSPCGQIIFLKHYNKYRRIKKSWNNPQATFWQSSATGFCHVKIVPAKNISVACTFVISCPYASCFHIAPLPIARPTAPIHPHAASPHTSRCPVITNTPSTRQHQCPLHPLHQPQSIWHSNHNPPFQPPLTQKHLMPSRHHCTRPFTLFPPSILPHRYNGRTNESIHRSFDRPHNHLHSSTVPTAKELILSLR